MLYGQMLMSALKLMTDGHAGQLDKGGMPYILHPLKVAHNLQTTDVELFCIALLHDFLEDVRGVSEKTLLDANMSARVVEGVNALTKKPGQTYSEYQAAVFANVDAMLVKRQDLLTNSDLSRITINRPVTDADRARVKKYLEFVALIDVRLAKMSK